MNRILLWTTVLIAGVLCAAGSAMAAAPIIDAPYADRPVEPSHFSSSDIYTHFASGDDYVRQISWKNWGGSTATGSGQVTLLDEGEPSATSPVTIRLGGLRQCAGYSVYTSYSLELNSGSREPRYWPRGQQGTWPCRIAAGGYLGDQPRANGCIFSGLQFSVDFTDAPRVPWNPVLPHHSNEPINRFCNMTWNNWGTPRTTADGIREARGYGHGVGRYWPMSMVLSDPIWCPTLAANDPFLSAITYSTLRVTLYGDGRPVTDAKTELAAIGTHTGTRQVYVQHAQPGPSLCSFDDPITLG